jgi:hypothetical protein
MVDGHATDGGLHTTRGFGVFHTRVDRSPGSGVSPRRDAVEDRPER